MVSRFSPVGQAPPVEIYAITKSYNEDRFEKKVSLGIGAYRTNENKPWVLPVVKKVEEMMAEDKNLDHEYLTIMGLDKFSSAATKLLLGEDNQQIREKRAVGVHSLSGTGSLRVGSEILSTVLGYNTFYTSSPTWENHVMVFKKAGFANARTYRYWNAEKRTLNIVGMLEDLENAPENAVIVLHACAHNPTGCDPSQDDWKRIADVIKKRKLFPFFDSAYQGFASGDVDKDAWAVRYFAKLGLEFFCSQSFAKNFGLYGERVGNLTMVLNDASAVQRIISQVTLIIRPMYSSPPSHGARIVATVLNDPKLHNEWKESIVVMANRVKDMRAALYSELIRLKTPGTWEHIITQIGMFSYTGLTKRQVEHLISKYHIYLLSSGRISMCGLNTNNVKYVAEAMHEAITKFPSQSHL